MSLWPVITAIRKFLHLNDTPASYSGQGGKYVKVAAAEDSLEFSAIVQAFLGLTDTPASYSGQGEKVVRVNVGEDALEFHEIVPGLWVSSDGEIYPSPSKHVRVADDKDIKFASGAKIERDAGHLKFTPESGKDVKLVMRAKARAHLGTTQTNIPQNQYTTLNLNEEDYDPGGNFSIEAHAFYTPITGYYSICASAYFFDVINDQGLIEMIVLKNATTIVSRIVTRAAKANTGHTIKIADILYLEAGDYIQLQVKSDAVGTDIYHFGELTYLAIHLLSVD